MSRWLFLLLLASSVGLWAQSSTPPQNSGNSSPAPANSQPAPQSSSDSKTPAPPVLAPPPRSDRVNATDLGSGSGESSSKDNDIDISPPPGDDKAHPHSSDALADEGSGASGDVGEMHLWDPHKAMKDVEVGDFYFKRKNYRAAEDRYREALEYKNNDAVATIRLAECLEKLDRSEEARQEYESYLRILPHGPDAERAQKALAKLKAADAGADAKAK
jgi:tetratricopeptide (TPR) repeat protein